MPHDPISTKYKRGQTHLGWLESKAPWFVHLSVFISYCQKAISKPPVYRSIRFKLSSPLLCPHSARGGRLSAQEGQPVLTQVPTSFLTCQLLWYHGSGERRGGWGPTFPGAWKEASLAHWASMTCLAPGSHASSPHWGSLLGPWPTYWPWPPLLLSPVHTASSDARNSPSLHPPSPARLARPRQACRPPCNRWRKRTVILGLSAHHSPVLLLPVEEHRGTSVSHLPKQTSSFTVNCQAPLLPGSNLSKLASSWTLHP